MWRQELIYLSFVTNNFINTDYDKQGMWIK